MERLLELCSISQPYFLNISKPSLDWVLLQAGELAAVSKDLRESE